MRNYAIRRLLQAIPLLLLLSAILFALVRAAPGGPLAQALRNPNISASQRDWGSTSRCLCNTPSGLAAWRRETWVTQSNPIGLFARW